MLGQTVIGLLHLQLETAQVSVHHLDGLMYPPFDQGTPGGFVNERMNVNESKAWLRLGGVCLSFGPSPVSTSG